MDDVEPKLPLISAAELIHMLQRASQETGLPLSRLGVAGMDFRHFELEMSLPLNLRVGAEEARTVPIGMIWMNEDELVELQCLQKASEQTWVAQMAPLSMVDDG